MRVAVILFARSDDQNAYFWPSYLFASSGCPHDLLLASPNTEDISDDIVNDDGLIVFERVSYAAKPPFHVYKDIFELHKEDYDIFCFVSEDAVIRRNGWLKKCVDMLSTFRGIGFVTTQLFNCSNAQYPGESHMRTSAWAATTEALDKVNWILASSPEAELADSFVEAGYYGAQVGHKIDVAFDSLTNNGVFVGDSVGSLLAKQLGIGLDGQIQEDKLESIHNFLVGRLKAGNDAMFVQSPFDHIGRRRVISQLQPFNGLIYDKSLHLVPNEYIERYTFDIVTLKGCLEAV